MSTVTVQIHGWIAGFWIKAIFPRSFGPNANVLWAGFTKASAFPSRVTVAQLKLPVVAGSSKTSAEDPETVLPQIWSRRVTPAGRKTVVKVGELGPELDRCRELHQIHGNAWRP